METPFTCPFCFKDLMGKKIPDEQRHLFDPSAEYFSKVIGVYDVHKDKTIAYRCPECNHEWTLK